MRKVLYQSKADLFGTMASAMCILHCIATPFIFLVPTSQIKCSAIGPWWWHLFDYLFLTLGFIAIYRSLKNTSIKWMPPLMYGSWILLVLFIVNSKASYIHLPSWILYIPAISLIALHLYNLSFNRSRNKGFI